MARGATIKLSDALKAQKKGMFAIEVDGMLLRLTKKQTAQTRQDINLRRHLGAVLRLGQLTAAHVRRRMLRGKSATTARRRGGRDPWIVRKAYAAKVGARRHRHDSMSAFYAAAGARKDTSSISGGMWKGLEIRGSGRDRAIISFRGTSIGGTGKSGRTAGGKRRKGPTASRVKNTLKAATVWRNKRINVLQPTVPEVAAMGAAAAVRAFDEVAATLGLGRRIARRNVEQLRSGVDPTFYRILLSRWRRGVSIG